MLTTLATTCRTAYNIIAQKTRHLLVDDDALLGRVEEYRHYSQTFLPDFIYDRMRNLTSLTFVSHRYPYEEEIRLDATLHLAIERLPPSMTSIWEVLRDTSDSHLEFVGAYVRKNRWHLLETDLFNDDTIDVEGYTIDLSHLPNLTRMSIPQSEDMTPDIIWPEPNKIIHFQLSRYQGRAKYDGEMWLRSLPPLSSFTVYGRPQLEDHFDNHIETKELKVRYFEPYMVWIGDAPPRYFAAPGLGENIFLGLKDTLKLVRVTEKVVINRTESAYMPDFVPETLLNFCDDGPPLDVVIRRVIMSEFDVREPVRMMFPFRVKNLTANFEVYLVGVDDYDFSYPITLYLKRRVEGATSIVALTDLPYDSDEDEADGVVIPRPIDWRLVA